MNSSYPLILRGTDHTEARTEARHRPLQRWQGKPLTTNLTTGRNRQRASLADTKSSDMPGQPR
jgi:hypothetical protein